MPSPIILGAFLLLLAPNLPTTIHPTESTNHCCCHTQPQLMMPLPAHQPWPNSPQLAAVRAGSMGPPHSKNPKIMITPSLITQPPCEMPPTGLAVMHPRPSQAKQAPDPWWQLPTKPAIASHHLCLPLWPNQPSTLLYFQPPTETF